MANNHVGVPRFIQEAFAKSGIVFSYDIQKKRIRKSPIRILGTEKDYYDEIIEKELANTEENEFAKFHKFVTSASDLDLIIECIQENTELIDDFLILMFMRSKHTLDIANSNELSKSIFGELSHSDLLKNQSQIKMNPLKLIGKEHFIVPLINKSASAFINNSIGVGVKAIKKDEIIFFVPLSPFFGIIFCNEAFKSNADCFEITESEKDKIVSLNKTIIETEIGYGNGYLFARIRKDYDDYLKYINNSLNL